MSTTKLQEKPSSEKKVEPASKGTEVPEVKKEAAASVEDVGMEMACRYLENKGCTIIEKRWRCKSGTADLIVEEDDDLVFIAIKARQVGSAGLPTYSTTKEKRAKFERIAISYLTENSRPSGRIRFDVIAVQMTGPNQCMLRHHQNAFSSADEG